MMFSLVLLLLPLRHFGVVPNDCRSSLSCVLNTIIIISGVINIIVTAYFIIIAVSLCCFFLLRVLPNCGALSYSDPEPF